MGIVIRQSILTSIISYVGVVIGYINLLYLFPKFLQPEQIGLLRTIQDTAMLFVPFAVVGLGQSIIKFYPRHSTTDREANAFISMILFFSGITLTVFLLAFFVFEDLILGYFKSNASQLLNYRNLILLLTILLVLITILEQYSRSLLEIAFPSLLREIIVRLLQALLVTVYFYSLINFPFFIAGSVWIYLIILLALVVFLFRKGGLKFNLDFRKIPAARKREIFTFSILSFIGTSSMILIGKMDSIMVTGMIGLKANAIYTTAFYMATVIEIPKRAITTTASPIISKAFGVDNIREIASIYQKTSINQMIIGALLLTGVYINLDNIFGLMPNGEIYKAGSAVILIIGGGKLIDMVFGPSSEIIGLSKHYWFNLVVITLLAIMIIIANYVLIPLYGITGAALGSLFSLFVYNFAKFLFIKIKFGIQPFDINTVKVLLITIGVLAVNFLLPNFDNIVVDIVIRSSIVTLIYCALILTWNCSEEVNKIWKVVLKYLPGSKSRQ